MTDDESGALLRRLFDAALAATDPAKAVPRFLPEPPPKGSGGRTVVVGAGKAAAAMARAVETNWKGPLDGLVVTRYGHAVPCRRIEVVEAARAHDAQDDEAGEEDGDVDRVRHGVYLWTSRMGRYPFKIALLIGAALAVLLSTSAAEAQTVDVVASGLNNPRGLALAPNGDLYLTDSGIAMDRFAPNGELNPDFMSLDYDGRVWKMKRAKFDLPPYGGDTLWTNLAAAYEGLSETLRGFVDTLRGIHGYGKVTAGALTETKRPSFSTEHPLVRVHPETGELWSHEHGPLGGDELNRWRSSP